MTSLVRVVDPPARGPQPATARGWVDLMLPAIELANTVAPTEFVPAAFRNKPPAIAAAILYGDEIGLGPMISLARIRVIEGTPTLLAEAQRALVLAAGHELWPGELTVTRAEWNGRRAGSSNTTTVVWTIDDAKRANLAGKFNWRTYPRQMLSARASAELVRAIFADVVGGLSATEEIEDQNELAIDAGAPERPSGRRTSTRRRQGRAAGGLAPAGPANESPLVTPPPDLPPLPGETEPSEPAPAPADDSSAPAMVTSPQRNRIMARYRELGFDRAGRLRDMGEIIGRRISSGNELTLDEASRILDDLETRDDPGAGAESPDPAEGA